MNTEQDLIERSDSKCELCGSVDDLSVYEVPPASDGTAERCILLCKICLEKIENTDKIDVHHDGTFLTAPLNYIHKNSFWLSTFYDYGVLGNNIGLIFYKIFGEYNLGSIRLSTLILLFFNKIILIFLSRKIVISIFKY